MMPHASLLSSLMHAENTGTVAAANPPLCVPCPGG
jgi:hypothetical protein